MRLLLKNWVLNCKTGIMKKIIYIFLFIPLMINPPVFSYINFINFINGYLIVTDDTAPFLKETDILNIPTLYTIFPVLELSL